MAQRQRKGQVAGWGTGNTGLLPAPALEKKRKKKKRALLLPLSVSRLPLNNKSIMYHHIHILVGRHPVPGPQYPSMRLGGCLCRLYDKYLEYLSLSGTKSLWSNVQLQHHSPVFRETWNIIIAQLPLRLGK